MQRKWSIWKAEDRLLEPLLWLGELRPIAGVALGTVNPPIIGTVSLVGVGGVTGAIAAFSVGVMTAYNFGRFLEKELLRWD